MMQHDAEQKGGTALMPDFIVIRLHPQDPTAGATFTNFIQNLTIKVIDRSFAKPTGVDSASVPNVIGSASQTGGTIIQHVGAGPAFPPASAATAVVQITTPSPHEYVTPDLMLQVTRGTSTLVERDLNYNVDILQSATAPAQDPLTYAALTPVALYLSLTPPLDPSVAQVTLPTDGTAPSYADVLAAMQAVVAKDPTGSPDLAQLTVQQCRHIAYEIIWNRVLFPLPPVPGSGRLEDLYAPGSSDQDRRNFESSLVSYYSTHNQQSEALTKYVFSVSAALACAQKADAAQQVGFSFQILPGLVPASGKIAEATVVVSST